MRIAVPLVVMLASFVHAADLQSSLQAKYDLMSKAFAKKDDSTFDKLLGPKYVLVGLEGAKLDRKTVLADFRRQMESMTGGSWDRTAGRPVLKGSTATVEVKSHLSGGLSQHGEKHVYDMRAVNRDSWVRGSSGWILVKTQVLSLIATLDGRPLSRG